MKALSQPCTPATNPVIVRYLSAVSDGDVAEQARTTWGVLLALMPDFVVDGDDEWFELAVGTARETVAAGQAGGSAPLTGGATSDGPASPTDAPDRVDQALAAVRACGPATEVLAMGVVAGLGRDSIARVTGQRPAEVLALIQEGQARLDRSLETLADTMQAPARPAELVDLPVVTQLYGAESRWLLQGDSAAVAFAEHTTSAPAATDDLADELGLAPAAPVVIDLFAQDTPAPQTPTVLTGGAIHPIAASRWSRVGAGAAAMTIAVGGIAAATTGVIPSAIGELFGTDDGGGIITADGPRRPSSTPSVTPDSTPSVRPTTPRTQPVTPVPSETGGNGSQGNGGTGGQGTGGQGGSQTGGQGTGGQGGTSSGGSRAGSGGSGGTGGTPVVVVPVDNSDPTPTDVPPTTPASPPRPRPTVPPPTGGPTGPGTGSGTGTNTDGNAKALQAAIKAAAQAKSTAELARADADRLAEQATAAQATVDRLTAKLAKAQAKADRLDAKAASLDAKADRLAAKAAALEAKADRLAAKAARAQARADEAKAKAAQVKKPKAKAKALARAAKLQARADSVRARADKVGARADRAGAKADKVTARAGSVHGRATAAHQRVERLEDKLAAATERAADLRARLTGPPRSPTPPHAAWVAAEAKVDALRDTV